MKNKNKIFLSFLAMILLSGSFLSLAAAEETYDSSQVAPDEGVLISPAPDENPGLIAPAPDDNLTDGEQRYYILDDETSANDTQAAEDQNAEPNLIAADTSNPDNTLAIVAVVALSAIVIAAAIGAVHIRKRSSKQAV